MAVFNYNALNKKGEPVQGEVESASREDLISYLDKKDLVLVSLAEKAEFSFRKSPFIIGGSLSLFDRYILFEDLTTMVKAGLPITEAIKILWEDAEKPFLKKILSDFQFTLEKGNPLSSAMEHYPKLFSPVVINLIKAGEASGNLERTLSTIAKQYKKDNDLRNKIKGAMIYPMLLLSLSVVVIIFLFVFVIPKLSVFFAQANIELPMVTKIVVGIGKTIGSSYVLDLAVIGIMLGFFIFLTKTLAGKKMLMKFIAVFPLTKKLFRQLTIYRYCWTMGVLIASGIGILESIEITKNVVANASFKESLGHVKEEVEKGVPLGNALKEQKGLFPNIVSGMTVVGEQTGDLENIYITLSKFYERTFSISLKALVRLVEPLLLLFMGLVVGGIAMSVVLPIYKFVSGVR